MAIVADDEFHLALNKSYAAGLVDGRLRGLDEAVGACELMIKTGPREQYKDAAELIKQMILGLQNTKEVKHAVTE